MKPKTAEEYVTTPPKPCELGHRSGYFYKVPGARRRLYRLTAGGKQIRTIASGQPARRFKEFQWSTRNGWSRQRRVIFKAGWGAGANPRFVVTSLSAEDAAPQRLYEEIYCARGDMKNRIRECQLDLISTAAVAGRKT